MRRLSAITILALLLFAFGANSYAQVSSAAVLFLRIAAGARAAGLGEAYVAIANDATATHWNPAGLGKYPLAPKWFQNDIPEEYQPIGKIALVRGEGSPSTDIDFDIWSFTRNGIIRYSNDKWQRASGIETKADDNLESILRRYTGLIGEGTDERVKNLIDEIARYNNKYPIDRLDSLKAMIMKNLDDGYSESDDFDSTFNALFDAYNKLIIDWRQFDVSWELTHKALRDGQIGEIEADKILFNLERAVWYLIPEIELPFHIGYEGHVREIAGMDDELWVATDSGLYRYNANEFQWQRFTGENSPYNLGVRKMVPYKKQIYICTDSGIVLYDGGFFNHFGPDQGLPHRPAAGVAISSVDKIWAVVDDDLYQYNGVIWKNYAEIPDTSVEAAETVYDRLKIYDTPAERERYIEKFNALNPQVPDLSGGYINLRDDVGEVSESNIDSLVDSLGVLETVNLMTSKEPAEEPQGEDLKSEAQVLGKEDLGGEQITLKIPFTAGFEFPVTAMLVDQFGILWIGTEHGLLSFGRGKWRLFGFRQYTFKPETSDTVAVTSAEPSESGESTQIEKPIEKEAIFDIALRRVRGDSTRAERLTQNIKDVNKLEKDSIAAGETIYIYANPAGARINDMLTSGSKTIFATSSGTIYFDGMWARMKERGLGSTNTYVVAKEGNSTIFVTRDRMAINAGARSQITGMHVNWLPELADDIYYEFLGYTNHVEGWGTIGANITFLSYGRIARTDAQGNPLGDFSAYDFAFTLSYGTKFTEDLSGGISAKFIYSHLSTLGAGRELGSGTSTGLAIDFGLLYRISSRLTMGMAVTNLGPEISYIDVSQSDPLPSNLGIGVAWKMIESPYNELLFTIEANKSLAGRERTILEDGRDVVATPQTELKGLFINPLTLGGLTKEFRNVIVNGGLEYQYGSFIAFRAGYIHDEVGFVKTPTLGVGISFDRFKFDFAYIPSNDDVPLANTMRFSLTADL